MTAVQSQWPLTRAASFATGAAVILFVAVQIQTTVSSGAVGIRLSAADIFLPVALLGGAVALRQGRFGILQPRTELLLLIVASLWLLTAIAHGRISFGHWQIWALVNRGAGWLAVLGFFAAAYAATALRPGIFPARAILAYLMSFWVSTVISALLMIVLMYHFFGLTAVPERVANGLEQTFGLVAGRSRFQGLVVNPNAFGSVAVAAIAFHLPFIKARVLLPRSAHVIGLGLSLFALAWTFSRGSWLALPVAVGFMAVIRRLDYGALVLAVLVALGLSAALWLSLSFSEIMIVGESDETRVIAGSPQSARARWIIAEQALALWRESPIFGAGVGAFLERQMTSAEGPLTTHSTYLWLLSETGAVGLLLFGLFFGAVFAAAIRALHDSSVGDVAAGLAAALVSFAVLALTMDVLFQRHLWLFIGVSLAACVHQGRQHPS